jgi:nucleotide-binding universal stress UspA family protein
LHIVEIPKAIPASAVGFGDVQHQLRDMESMERHGKKYDVDVDAKLLVSHEIAPTIVDASRREDIEVIVLGWHGLSKMGVVMGSNLDHIIANADADVVVFKSTGLKKKLKNITLLHGHGWHVSQAADLAAFYANHHGGTVTVLHVHTTDECSSEDHKQAEHLAKLVQNKGAPVLIRMVKHADIVQGVLNETITSDILFLGAADITIFGRTLFGDLPDRIAKFVQCPVVILKKVAHDKPLEGIDRVE